MRKSSPIVGQSQLAERTILFMLDQYQIA